MSDETVVPARRGSAFLQADERRKGHIVDILIEERCPKLRAHPFWPALRPALYQLLGYAKARRMADELMQLDGRDSFDKLARQLDFNMTIHHIDRVPRTGRVIIAANHPTGLADGVAVWDLLKRVRQDIVFFANADAIRVNPRFDDVVIPVEWVMSKRTPAKARETLRRAAEAFAEEKCVVIFPSGRLARKTGARLEEKEWFPTVVGLARKQNAPVVPLNLDAWNSRLYYLFCDLNPELRDITLFHELLNKRGSRFEMTFGHPILPDALQGDAAKVTERLQNFVAYGLRADPHGVFAP